jgi:hypothetical protein
MDGWVKVKEAGQYAGLSERTMRDHLKRGLRCSRLPSGTILIKYKWIDDYLESFAEKKNCVDRVVDEVIREL